MSEPRNQFTFYRSYYDAIQELSKKDQAAIILAVCNYAIYEVEPAALSPAASTAFKLIRPTLDSGRRKAANGKQGGSKPKANAKQSVREKEIEKEKEIEIENEVEKEGNAEACPGGGFDVLWTSYPEPRRGSLKNAKTAFITAVHSDSDAAAALENLEAWKNSDQWCKEGGQYVPYLSNWLERGLWQAKPPESVKGSIWGSMNLGDAEYDAIRAVLAQPLKNEPEGIRAEAGAPQNT